MNIGEPTQAVLRGKHDFAPVAKALESLPEGLSLPVTVENEAEAQSLINAIYTQVNRGPIKYKCTRRKLTVYIFREKV